jgi:TetR/AcrR family transcriptional regulator, cholesterol catabolism regulator
MAEQSVDAAPRAATATSADGTRERILTVALRLFYARGYRGTSLSAIADEVGISAPSVYWHFESKHELCFACVRDELRRFIEGIERGTQGADPRTRLGGFVRAYVLLKLEQNEWLEQPGAGMGYRQLRDALKPARRAEIDALQRQVLSLLRSVLRAGRDDGVFGFDDVDTTAFAVITMCEYVYTWVQPGGRLSPDEIADEYRDLVLAMVRAST